MDVANSMRPEKRRGVKRAVRDVVSRSRPTLVHRQVNLWMVLLGLEK